VLIEELSASLLGLPAPYECTYPGLGFGVWGSGFGVWGLGVGVYGWGLGVRGSGLRGWGFGFGV